MKTPRPCARASLFALLAALLSLCHQARGADQVYRSVDAQGRVIFSDRPCPEAEEVELKQPNVVTSPEHGPAYARIAFGSPAAGSVVPVGSADHIELRLDMEPRLRPGHRVQLLVDGAAAGSPSGSCSFTIHSIGAGSHRFEARVLDRAGTELARSEPLLLQVARPLTGAAPAITPAAPRDTRCVAPADSRLAPSNPAARPAPRRLGAEEQRTLLELFRRIGPNWRGSGQRISCEAGDGELRATEESLQVEADFEAGHDTMTISYRTHSRTAQTRGADIIELHLAEDELSQSGAIVDLRGLSPDGLLFSSSFRPRDRQGHPGRWHDAVRRMAISGSRLTLEQWFYVDGRLTASEHWELAH